MEKKMSEWQPIDSAPESKTVLVCYCGYDPLRIKAATYEPFYKRWREFDGEWIDDPTYWHDFPAFPEKKHNCSEFDVSCVREGRELWLNTYSQMGRLVQTKVSHCPFCGESA